MTLEEYHALAPAGFYLALRIGFAFPVAEHNHLPELWVREYTLSGLIVHDPAVAWAYRNDGTARWGELGNEDRLGVLEMAKAHGLRFGAVASCRDQNGVGQRSFGLFCRSDRDFDAAELARLAALLAEAHGAHERPRNLTAAELETLGLVKNGLLMKEIACVLGISESAIKQRLRSARVKLRAKTGSQAAAKATMLGMI
jgi:LuxR family transcriptional regulator